MLLCHLRKTRESVTPMECFPNKCMFEKGCKLISLIVLMQVDFSNNVNAMLWTKKKKISITKGNNSFIMQKRVMVLVHCTSPHRDLPNYELSHDSSSSFCVMLQTKYKYEKFQRAITPKLCKRELWFLFTAPPLIKIYIPMKFQVDTSNSFGVLLRTKYKYE